MTGSRQPTAAPMIRPITQQGLTAGRAVSRMGTASEWRVKV